MRWIDGIPGVTLVAALAAGCASMPQPAAPAGVPVTYPSGVVREDLRFACGHTRCAGWLFRPGSGGPAPVVVMAHGMAGTRDLVIDEVGRAFAEAGYASFVFDYRFFGDSGGSPRQLVDPWWQLDDWRAAIDFVKSQPGIDPARLGLWASSQGAGHVLLLAQERTDVVGVVGQVPLVDTSQDGEAVDVGVGWALRMVFTAWGDLLWSMGHDDAVMVPAIGPSGSFAYIPDDGALKAAQRLQGQSATYRNEIAARSILTYDEYNPAAAVEQLHCPVLLIASRDDRFVPYAAVQGVAARSPRVEVVDIPGDHFDVYLSPVKAQATAAALGFWRRVFAPG